MVLPSLYYRNNSAPVHIDSQPYRAQDLFRTFSMCCSLLLVSTARFRSPLYSTFRMHVKAVVYALVQEEETSNRSVLCCFLYYLKEHPNLVEINLKSHWVHQLWFNDGLLLLKVGQSMHLTRNISRQWEPNALCMLPPRVALKPQTPW